MYLLGYETHEKMPMAGVGAICCKMAHSLPIRIVYAGRIG